MAARFFLHAGIYFAAWTVPAWSQSPQEDGNGTAPEVPAAARPDLTGAVLDQDRKPLAGATIAIYTAGPKTGTSTKCPSCYPDCAKVATSAADGRFAIGSLDPNLLFRVLVVAEGFAPEFVAPVDPAKGKIETSLKPIDQARLKPGHVLRGRVLDPDGSPVFGASVSPSFIRRSDGTGRGGSLPGIDPLVVTNAKGEFALTTNEPGLKLVVKVEARGLLTVRSGYLPVGEEPHVLRMRHGVTVKGRVVKGGRPVAGVVVGVTQVNRSALTFLGHQDVATDAEGRFVIQNVNPDDDHFVYGKMDSLKAFGALPPKKVRAGADRSDLDVGDLAVVAGFRLAGRLTLADDKPVPSGTRIQLSSRAAWDSQVIEIDAAGGFAFENVPPEQYSLTAKVRGYRLSRRNESFDPLNHRLFGRVTADSTDLCVLMELGDREPAANPIGNRDALDAYRKVQEELLRGIPKGK